jgi:hypothetical protein
MSDRPPLSAADRLARARALEAALQQAVRAAVLTHAWAGHPVAAGRAGKVVWIQPDEILKRKDP